MYWRYIRPRSVRHGRRTSGLRERLILFDRADLPTENRLPRAAQVASDSTDCNFIAPIRSLISVFLGGNPAPYPSGMRATCLCDMDLRYCWYYAEVRWIIDLERELTVSLSLDRFPGERSSDLPLGKVQRQNRTTSGPAGNALPDSQLWQYSIPASALVFVNTPYGRRRRQWPGIGPLFPSF